MRIAYPLERCGLFYLDGPTRHALPLEGVHVAARVVDLVAEVQVVQFYVNATGRMIDTLYEFPLDDSAAVCGFEAELEDKLLIGEVREKEEARMEYQAAIARGETAALLEQNSANVFTQRIGNIKPFSRVNIRITYVADLKVEADGSVRFVLPTSLAPRYTPYHVRYLEPEFVVIPWRRPWHRCCLGRRVIYRDDYVRCFAVPVHDFDVLPWYGWRYYTPEHVVARANPCAFSFTLEVEMPSRVTNVTSNTHTIRWEAVPGAAEGTQASASFWSDTEPMGKDLVIQIHQHKAHEPHVEIEVAPDGSGCAMVTMVPEFDIDPEPTEIIFLVDTSGSMRGDRIAAAKRALELFLRSLPMGCAFNMYQFSSSHSSLFSSGSQSYTQSTMQSGIAWIQRLNAYGGTELLPPLNDIFRRHVACGRARQVFILTDGQVSNTPAVIELCRANAHNSRIFTVGIGDEVDRHLVEGMARAGTGTAEFIQGTELRGQSGVLEGKLINQLRNATLPSITKVMIDWGELGSLTPPADSPSASASPSSSASSSSPAASSAPAAAPGGPSLATLRVRCEKVEGTEELYITGSIPELGTWDPSKAVKMYTNPHAFPVWAGSFTATAEQPFNFKFIKKRPDGYIAFESFEGNRTATASGSECTIDCGAWNVLSSPTVSNIVPAAAAPAAAPASHDIPSAAIAQSIPAPTPTVVSAPTPAPAPTNPAASSISRFFPTGPAQQRPGIMSFVGSRTASSSVHGVGSGFGVHAPTTLTPGVGFGHDASSAQAHGRNSDLYQAPFLPPPVFSGAKFVMYALFAPGKLPINTVRISAEAPGGQLLIDVPITKLSTVGKTLHVLAARALIRDLEDGTSHLHWRQTGVPPSLRGGGSGVERYWFRGWLGGTVAVGGAGQDRGSAWHLEPVTPPAPVVRAEMIDLGIRFGLTSSATSFVAVERWMDGRSGAASTAPVLPSQALPPSGPPPPPAGASPSPYSPSFLQSAAAPADSYRSRESAGGRGAPPARRLSATTASASSFAAPPPMAPMAQSMSYGAPPPMAPSMSYGAPPPMAPSMSYGAPPPMAPSMSYGAPPPMAPSMSYGAPPPMAPSMSYGAAPPSMSSFSSSISSAPMGFGAAPSMAPPSMGFYKADSYMEEKASSISVSSLKKKSSSSRSRTSASSVQSLDLLCSEDCDEEESLSCELSLSPRGSASSSSGPSAIPLAFPPELLGEVQFEGYFLPSAVVARSLGSEPDLLRAAALSKKSAFGSADDQTAINLWVSILVLAAFESRWESSRSTWAMIAEKTRAWCVSTLGRVLGTDRAGARQALERLIGEAK